MPYQAKEDKFMPRQASPSTTAETAIFAQELIAKLGSEPVVLGNAATGETARLPSDIAELMRQVLENLAAGRSVTVTYGLEELTPNEAAEFLNVSRPYVAKLLDGGVLPYRQVGSHRRIPYADLAAYKEQQRARSRAAMREMTRLSEEMGLYRAAETVTDRGS
jgi:excisionase family DNA binding protein